AWERRFAVVEPGRSESGRRLYSDADIVRLKLLASVTKEGWSIGRVAELPNADLLALLDDQQLPPARPAETTPPIDLFLAGALEAVRHYDGHGLDRHLWRAVVALAPADFFDRVLTPLLVEIGELWRAGELAPASEHIATAVIRRVLGRIADAIDTPAGIDHIAVGTPAGQVHDIGALLVAASAAAEGWAVTYLGPDLPAPDIARAARRAGARVVALSIIHPADDRQLPGEISALREALPDDVAVVVGGAAAGAYARAIAAAGAHLLDDLAALRGYLRALARTDRHDRSA
ncbi:MAG: cobalamin-dependent protein, partial [Synechococcaceae cyanobacterium]|nr:cobalamin-dependent protein [Synechococcaceae cyanobacterium]